MLRRGDHRLIGVMLLGHPDRMFWSTDLPNLYKESPYIPLFTEIGYAFGRAYWGQGYATEAARAVLEYAFGELRVSRFEIAWDKGPINPRSFNVYHRLGFEIKDEVDVNEHDVLLIKDNPIADLLSLAATPPPDFDDSPVAESRTTEMSQPNNLKAPVALETGSLLLRGIESSDIQRMVSLTNNNAHNARFFGKVHSFDCFDGAINFAQESPVGTCVRHAWAYDGLGSWAIVRKADDSLMGHISLGPAARTYWILFPDEADFPYARWEVDLVCIVGEPYWGKGYDTEACEALIEYAFREMKLARIVNHLDAGDTRSISLFEGLGFAIDRNLHPHYGGLVAILPNKLDSLVKSLCRSN